MLFLCQGLGFGFLRDMMDVDNETEMQLELLLVEEEGSSHGSSVLFEVQLSIYFLLLGY